MAEEQRAFIPPKRPNTDYPVIDTDPHWRRAFGYARPEDWTYGAGVAAIGPAFMLMTERYAPSFAGKGAFPPVFRLSVGIGLLAGAGMVYQRSCLRFYGWTENDREVKRDMREMVEKVKKGEPLYGVSDLSEYHQGVAARNSRYSALLAHIVPWANFVNHNQHGVDTAKYYQQAERELEASRLSKQSR
ncbi:NADH dehydrogenase [Exophiala aquamarina CBS 119918]|uniref:NADH dehydrogenase n=1 Tax=Exophiala aquamarina CBS 119918 TaxID=1182545 RepID=A0A072PG76_9EURO|nr:NADH dehydrogenase [Exophiala aquamarina CBS 119918]KEF59149.1 NADH dehydrogenase [Exophiala aquamarina CBS 119918]